MGWLDSLMASYNQSATMHAAWKYNVSELDVAEADDISYEAAEAAGELRHWYDARTGAYIETTYSADYLNEMH